MGCTASSRVDDSEVLLRCKKRKHSLKQAVKQRHEFAIAHIAYIHSLTSIGSALLRFAGAPIDSSSSEIHLQDDEIHLSPPTPTHLSSSSSQHSSPPPPSTPVPTVLSPPPSSPPPPPPTTPPVTPPAEVPPSPPPPPQQENEQQKADAIEVTEPEKEEKRDIQVEEKTSETVPPQASPPPPPPLAQAPPNTHEPRSLSPPPTHLHNTFPSPHHSPNSSPPYSPSREQANLFMHFPSFISEDPPPPPSPPRDPPPPPSPPRDYTWDYFDFFQLAPIPFHLHHQQGVKVKHVDEEEEAEDLEEVQEQKEIPDLENELHENEQHENEQQEAVAIELKQPEIEEKREIRFEEKPAEAVPKEQPVETVPEEKPVENVPPKAVEDAAKEKEPEVVKEKIPEKMEEPIKRKEEVPVVQKVAAPVKVTVPGGQNKKQEKKDELSVIISSGKNLIDVAKHVNIQFKRAYASGKDVAGLLEATKVHSHLPFSEFRDSIKVFNAITSYWSSKTPLTSKDSDEDSDMAECGMAGSHASTLERLFAWEKKLYEEVKAGEAIRLAFDRKCKQLKSQDAKGADPNVIDKTRADMKKLDTRLMVAICAIHLTSLRIQKVTDEEMYPQLLEILKGLMSMWKAMLECHKLQKKIAANLMTLESSAANEEISEAHRKATVELENQMDNWQKCFSQWIDSQSSYITNLFSWLTSCQLEADSKGRVAPSYQPESPAVFSLIENWYMAVERLKDHKEMVDAVNNFSTVLHSLQLEQLEELQQKRRAEGFAKDLDQKILLLQNMEKKYVERPFESDEKEDYTGMRSTIKNTLQERRVSLNELRSRVTEEKKKHDTSLQDRREATIRTLKTNLPNIFEAIAAFAATAVDEYERLQLQ